MTVRDEHAMYNLFFVLVLHNTVVYILKSCWVLIHASKEFMLINIQNVYFWSIKKNAQCEPYFWFLKRNWKDFSKLLQEERITTIFIQNLYFREYIIQIIFCSRQDISSILENCWYSFIRLRNFGYFTFKIYHLT